MSLEQTLAHETFPEISDFGAAELIHRYTVLGVSIDYLVQLCAGSTNKTRDCDPRNFVRQPGKKEEKQFI